MVEEYRPSTISNKSKQQQCSCMMEEPVSHHANQSQSLISSDKSRSSTKQVSLRQSKQVQRKMSSLFGGKFHIVKCAKQMLAPLLVLTLLAGCNRGQHKVSAWHLFEPTADAGTRVIQAMTASLSGPANQPPSLGNSYQQLMSPAMKQPAQISTLVESAPQMVQIQADRKQADSEQAVASKPSILGKILEAPLSEKQQNATSPIEKLGQAAAAATYQLMKGRRNEKDSSKQVASAEQQIISQHARLHLSGGSHQRLTPKKAHDQRTSSMLDASDSRDSTSGQSWPLLSLFGGLRSGVTSRSSQIAKAIGDNGLAKTLSSVSKSLGGNKYVAGAAAASALAALGLTVSKLFGTRYMSGASFLPPGETMLGSGSTMYGTSIAPPDLPYNTYYTPAGAQPTSGYLPTRSNGNLDFSASTLDPSSFSSSSYDFTPPANSGGQEIYLKYTPAPPSGGDAFGSTTGGHYTSYYSTQQPSAGSYPESIAANNGGNSNNNNNLDSFASLFNAPSESRYNQPSSALAPTVSSGSNQLYPLGSNNQQDSMPSASFESPVYSVQPPPVNFIARPSGSGTGRRSGSVPLKIDEATRRLIQQQLQSHRQQQEAQLMYLLSNLPQPAPVSTNKQQAGGSSQPSSYYGNSMITIDKPSAAQVQPSTNFGGSSPSGSFVPMVAKDHHQHHHQYSSNGRMVEPNESQVGANEIHHAPLSSGSSNGQQQQGQSGNNLANSNAGYSNILKPATDLSSIAQLIKVSGAGSANDNNKQSQDPEASDSSPMRAYLAPTDQQPQQRQQRAWQFLVPNGGQKHQQARLVQPQPPQASAVSSSNSKLQQQQQQQSLHRVSRTPNQSSGKTAVPLSFRHPIASLTDYEPSKGLNVASGGGGGGLISIVGPSFAPLLSASSSSSGASPSKQVSEQSNGQKWAKTTASNLIQLSEPVADNKSGAIKLIEANGTPAALSATDGKLATGDSQAIMSPAGNNEDSSSSNNNDDGDNQQVTGASKQGQWTAMMTRSTSASGNRRERLEDGGEGGKLSMQQVADGGNGDESSQQPKSQAAGEAGDRSHGAR